MMSKSQPQREPADPLVAASCLDFLLIELVPLAQSITEQLLARDRALIEARKHSYIFNAGRTSLPSDTKASAQRDESGTSRDSASIARDSTADSVAGATAVSTVEGSSNGGTGPGPVLDVDRLGGQFEDENGRDAAWFRLEQMGYRVGQGLVERFSANKARPQTPLDCIKFLCKDFWTLVYRKPIDNLKTNHRGIFVLTDGRFYPLSKMSADLRTPPKENTGAGAAGARGVGGGVMTATAANKAREEATLRAQSYLVFPSGLIRGVMQGLGVECTVVSETIEVPSARFEIRVKGAKP